VCKILHIKCKVKTYSSLFHSLATFIHSLIHPFIQSCFLSLIHSLIRSFTHSFIHSFILLFIHSFVLSFTHSFTYSFIHSFTHSFFHSCIHSFIHHSFNHVNNINYNAECISTTSQPKLILSFYSNNSVVHSFLTKKAFAACKWP